ncbi:MAG: hemerythrin domain-containing protein [Rubrivivax sp.]|nr:hemerythrin domain-containing protein [Rubrivivax sp.]
MLMTETPARDEVTASVCHGSRVQPYRCIHKALRSMMFRTLQQAAALDAADADERTTLLAGVDELLQVCSEHLGHENSFFHSALRERAPRAVLAFDDDHQGHLQAIAALRTQAARVAAGGSAVRGEAYVLYLALTRFVGENLEHMADEETRLTHAFWQHFSDAEIEAIEQRLRATFSPEKHAFYARWMARSLDAAELAELAAGARASLPPEAFNAVYALLMAELPAPRQARLARALGLAPVPGLVTA